LFFFNGAAKLVVSLFSKIRLNILILIIVQKVHIEGLNN
jgi:hypothetical protein